MLQPNGCIRYVHTSGFAILRSRFNIKEGVFDPRALKAEDTLLLAQLMENGKLPFFLADAIVQHAVKLSVVGCLKKDARSAYLEAPTYRMISAQGLTIRVSHYERQQMLILMWRMASQADIGRSAWFLVTARQAIRRTISYLYPCLAFLDHIRRLIKSFSR